MWHDGEHHMKVLFNNFHFNEILCDWECKYQDKTLTCPWHPAWRTIRPLDGEYNRCMIVVTRCHLPAFQCHPMLRILDTAMTLKVHSEA